MASQEKYDRLEDSTTTGDKDELLEEPGAGTPSHGGHGGHFPHLAALQQLKKPKEVLEAGKAVLADQSRGLRIIVTCAIVFALIITIALILSIYLGPPQIGANAAVATDVKECSDLGLSLLKKGGNAMDAAVAAMLCVGVVNAESSGIGGGGFMLVHDHKNGASEVFDFRETAPAQSTADMFQGNRTNTRTGGLSVAVPGELRGMEQAHKKYGKLAWKSVVSPVADLARKGFKMTGHTEMVLNSPKFPIDDFMQSRLSDFYMIDGAPLKSGSVIRRPDLAGTLDKIANGGADVLYKGSLADDIVDAVAKSNTQSVLTKDDLFSYEVEVREVVKGTYHGYTVESVPPPGSGSVLISILKLLEGYPLKQDNVSYHHILEAFKFGFAQKERLSDPKFNGAEVENATKQMISKEEASRIRNLTANVNTTMDAQFYSQMVGLPEDKGTSHISIIDTAELTISVTTTVNYWFGSMVLTDSGILLNNEMADFSLPTEGNKLNEIAPGKRPMSSMCPTVVYETGHLCGLRMVLGGANGSRIITGVAETLLNNLTFGMTLDQSIHSPRVHAQLKPDAKVVEAEEKFPEKVAAALQKYGHTVVTNPEGLSAVNAVLKKKDEIEAVSDLRKSGAGASLFD